MCNNDIKMRIAVKVVPRSCRNVVEQEDNKYIVRTTQAPVDNKANDAVQKALARYFGVSKSCVQIVKGHTARNKVCEITL